MKSSLHRFSAVLIMVGLLFFSCSTKEEAQEQISDENDNNGGLLEASRHPANKISDALNKQDISSLGFLLLRPNIRVG